jgi:hypothetical protein
MFPNGDRLDFHTNGDSMLKVRFCPFFRPQQRFYLIIFYPAISSTLEQGRLQKSKVRAHRALDANTTDPK